MLNFWTSEQVTLTTAMKPLATDKNDSKLVIKSHKKAVGFIEITNPERLVR